MTARTLFPVRVTKGPALPDLQVVVAALAVTSAAELAILRTFTRTAIHIPAVKALRGPYTAVSMSGEYAYFVTLALLLPALALVAWTLARSKEPGRLVAIYGLVIFSAAFVLAAADPESEVADVATVMSVSTIAGAFAMNGLRRYAVVPISSFAVAFLAGGAYTILPALQTHGLEVGQQSWMLSGMELTGLSFAISAPLVVGHRPVGAAKWIAVATFILVLAAFLGGGSSSRFLLLWNVGLTGTLPAVAYAGAAAGLAAALTGLVNDGRLLTAAGLALLVTGGIGLHSTYQSALVVVGLAAICCAAPAKARHLELQSRLDRPQPTAV